MGKSKRETGTIMMESHPFVGKAVEAAVKKLEPIEAIELANCAMLLEAENSQLMNGSIGLLAENGYLEAASFLISHAMVCHRAYKRFKHLLEKAQLDGSMAINAIDIVNRNERYSDESVARIIYELREQGNIITEGKFEPPKGVRVDSVVTKGSIGGHIIGFKANIEQMKEIEAAMEKGDMKAVCGLLESLPKVTLDEIESGTASKH
jgi:hypothetical protein